MSFRSRFSLRGGRSRGALRTTSRTRSRSSGFSMKSNAPEARRLDRGRDRAVPRDHDDRKRGVRLLDPGEDLEPVHARHLDVEEHGVGAFASSRFRAVFAGRRLAKRRSPRTRGSSGATIEYRSRHRRRARAVFGGTPWCPQNNTRRATLIGSRGARGRRRLLWTSAAGRVRKKISARRPPR